MTAAGKGPPRRFDRHKAGQMERELGKFLERFARLRGRAYFRDAPAAVRNNLSTAEMMVTAARDRVCGIIPAESENPG